jgi:hypothetical protein
LKKRDGKILELQERERDRERERNEEIEGFTRIIRTFHEM